MRGEKSGASRPACSYASFSYSVNTLSTSSGEGVSEGPRAPVWGFPKSGLFMIHC